MIQALLLTLIGGILGIAVLAISLMAVRAPKAGFQWPLGALLLIIAILVSPPLMAQVMADYHVSAIALGLPALMLLGPLLWFYVRALTSESKWRLSRRELLHFIPATAAIGIVMSFHTFPLQVREAMVLRGQLPEGLPPALLGLLTWLLILLWVPQSCYYLVRCGRQLLHYRSRLKHVFANTEKREMTWLFAFVIALAAIWLFAIAAVVSSNLFDHSIVERGGVTLMALMVAWILSVLGLSQNPGYEGHYLAEASPVPTVQAEMSTPEKYSRSALDKDRSAQIAIKIEEAMVASKLYLNSDLTLGDLAQAVGVMPNYVSQTLNETMGETFFDYINRKRIETAQVLLLESDRTAHDIAYDVGFNARSSFYKAFRRVTGVTPSQYRQA